MTPKIRRLAWLLVLPVVGFAAEPPPGPSATHPRADHEGALIFVRIEEAGPDLERMQAAITNAAWQEALAHLLPRYHSASLTPATLAFLESTNPVVRRTGVISLIHQNAAAPAIRARVVARLADASPGVREAVAEYLLWHGTAADHAALRLAAASETDPHTRAALAAAETLIARRADHRALNAGASTNLASRSSAQPLPPATYADALGLLTNSPGPLAVEAAADFYRNQDAFDPLRAFKGRLPETEEVLERFRRYQVAQELFGFTRTREMGDAGRPGEQPPADAFMPPVRDFFDPDRKYFGVTRGTNSAAFSGTVHVGDDINWHRDNLTVVAAADGVVRRALYNQTWGHIVVIEHRMPDASWFSSLYGHLSPALTVKPGDVVRKGQRIGSLGRTFTWENGGYRSHLHFAIRAGEYGEGRWIAGYYPVNIWNEGKHGWMEPQEFIRSHAGPAAPAP